MNRMLPDIVTKSLGRYLISSCLVVSLGCQKLLEPHPRDTSLSDSFYTDQIGALAAINAAYAPLTFNGAYQECAWKIGDITSDDTIGGEPQLDDFTYDPNNSTITHYWNDHFKGIFACNVVLSRLEHIAFSSTAPFTKNRIEGEAKFLRALYYFNLVRAFGSVPLYTAEFQSAQEANKARDSASSVYAQIEEDLKQATRSLPLQYAGGTGNEVGRATLGASQTLLAKVYLTQHKYVEAAAQADNVIKSGSYKLTRNFADNFYLGSNYQENNAESVFEVQFNSDIPTYTTSYMGNSQVVNTPEGYQENRPSDNTVLWNGFPIKGGLVQAYADGDLRKGVTMSRFGIVQPNGQPGVYLAKKYADNKKYAFRRSGVNYPIIRYAEVLLIYAEATNETSGPTPEAYDAINQVRRRAYGFTTNAPSAADLRIGLSQAEFREAVYRERRVELALEGHRWFDLLRTGRAVNVMQAHGKTNIKSLFPIPQTEMNSHKNHPGWWQNP